MLHGALVDSCALHTNQEVILVINEKDENILTQAVVLRGHVVLRMGQEPWLENGSKIRSRHLIDIGLGGEDGKQVQDVQEQLSVQRWQSLDLVLIYANGGIWVEASHRGLLSFTGSDSFGLVAF